jgi:hypothetical protein
MWKHLLVWLHQVVKLLLVHLKRQHHQVVGCPGENLKLQAALKRKLELGINICEHYTFY